MLSEYFETTPLPKVSQQLFWEFWTQKMKTRHICYFYFGFENGKVYLILPEKCSVFITLLFVFLMSNKIAAQTPQDLRRYLVQAAHHHCRGLRLF